MGRLFGTDGVRGVANSELTPELAFNLGKAGASVLGESRKNPMIIIGKDTRVSGDMLENALTAGILAVGGNVIKVGVIPTPAVAYLVRHYEAQAGVVISASHNPFEYNGIKFFNSEGFKLDDAIEEKIEDLIIRGIDPNAHMTGEALGTCMEGEENAMEIYRRYLLSTIDVRLDGMTVVMDCANGASYKVAPRVYRDLGARVIPIGCSPNGVNINDHIGSTHPEKLQQKVREEHADIGLAYDGDADRLIVVDENGEVIDGDKTICICARMLKDDGKLAKNKVTATVMSNLGFHKYIEKMGADVDVTDVGDRYVLEAMLKSGCVIGGEQSGHIIFRDYSTTGDGAVSSLQFMKALKRSGRKPSELAAEITLYPQVLVNARVTGDGKTLYKKDEEVLRAVEIIEEKMAGDGRVLIRPSGTEPLVRIMIEGRDKDAISEMAQALADLISSKYGK
ncbi:phosphoglucosamine mutase [Hornefia butyriciproducens]|uniref:phosphoglucosamine mutase n=1 Tax=Hornefia butyriciproducens TaxID=2652293 RepID=UPI0029FA5BA6|nr:phosphoglucosamine mutase [Hornefia butyriciproducens]MCI7327180.1 phosphoglucosamine mutase [Clostridiales bacterium]MCI7679362.1 phosphoglucosamine mutase [Clostridiales bacterium]MDD7020721.1 phosphoglucosamine mutase [Hornefia butyriciproducens]MDY2991142.1 phosphoglucosamine mutase [Hornefia butyriciproducens]MDY6212501.1 phosphoglucosamine mutase [Hornefia butyriciproducens]